MDALKALEAIVGILNGFWYRIVGGWAVDGYVGHITRHHDDVDVLILEEELEKVQEVLRKNSLSFSLLPYKIHTTIDGVPVGLGIIRQCQDFLWLITFPQHKWPVSLLRREEALLEGTKFWVPSLEFLLSLKLTDNRKEKADDLQYLLKLGADVQIATKHCFPYEAHMLQVKQTKGE